MSKYWFLPKTYGLGATPSTWQGWALIAGFIVAILALAAFMHVDAAARAAKPLSFLAIVAVLTLALIAIAWVKTEGGWRWRWGKRD